MKNNVACAMAIAHIAFVPAAKAASEALLNDLVKAFSEEYKAMKIPDFDLSYQVNFSRIQELSELKIQAAIFSKYQNNLQRISRSELNSLSKNLYDHFNFELTANSTRVALESEFKASLGEVPSTGLYQLPRHEKWYEFYLQRFASMKVSASFIRELGFSEIKRVSGEIQSLQKALAFEGNDKDFYQHLRDESFYLNDEKTVLERYDHIQKTISSNLSALFDFTQIPPVKVISIPNPDKDTPPGYYKKGAFYFNFFQGRHGIRAMDWLFMHEAIPGHYYMSSLRKESNPLSELFWYPGLSEGWAAYVENLGTQVGVYQDLYSQLGKWEWDLVRSTRLVIDVGIHHDGWSKEQALSFWRQNVPHQEEIALREVDRIIRWPAQVVSYKVGEHEIFKWRSLALEKVTLKKFHTDLLGVGMVPLPVAANAFFSN